MRCGARCWDEKRAGKIWRRRRGLKSGKMTMESRPDAKARRVSPIDVEQRRTKAAKEEFERTLIV